MIPPSIVLIIYGLVTETSIHKLFIAAIVPGLMLGDAGVFADSGKTRLRPDMVWHFVLHQYASVISFAAFWSRGVLSEIGNAAAHRLV